MRQDRSGSENEQRSITVKIIVKLIIDVEVSNEQATRPIYTKLLR